MAKPMPAGIQGAVKEMRVQEALREALRSEMARDSRVFVMGEDVALFGGAYGVTRGLMQEFSESRVLDTPISESALVGLAVGAAINGMRPVVEIQFSDLLPLAMDQLASHAARYHYMTGGRIDVSMCRWWCATNSPPVPAAVRVIRAAITARSFIFPD
jgi:pyruvate/2-oxoglutarate/acetoin dehydrogenase E1 component